MVERVLTPPEIDDLLSIFRGGRKSLARDVDVADFDLNQPSRIPRGAFEALRIRYEQAARAIAQHFKSVLGNLVVVTLDGFEQVLFDPWRKRLSDPCCAFVVDMHPLSEPALLVINHRLGFTALDRLLGGHGDTDIAPRDLTSTETGVLEELLEPIVNAHVQAWQPYTSLTGSIRRPVFVPQFIREIPDKEVVLAASYRVEGFGEPCELQFAIPASGLEPHLQHEPRPELSAEDVDGSRDRMAKQLSRVDIEISVRLGEAVLSLRELVDLEVDDVIVLDNDIAGPVDLLVEDKPQIWGFLRRIGRRLVFQCNSRVGAPRPGTDAESGAPGAEFPAVGENQ